MKKLLIRIAMLAVGASAVAQQVYTTNITAGAGLHLISTNRMKVYSIEVSSTNAFNYRFYDTDNTTVTPTSSATGWWGTNFVSGQQISRTTYLTNIASSYVGYNGFTNWYTNAGLYTLTTTNAQATNAMSPSVAISTGGAETRVTYVDAIFTRGVAVQTSGNGSITIYYRPE